jgi:hypothetical protein
MKLRPHLHLRHSSSGRDAALDRLRWLNRSIIAGSVALTAIFADTAANTFAGGTSQAKRTGARHARASSKSEPTQTTTRPGPLAPPAESPSNSSEREPEPEATPTQEPAPSEAAPQTEEPAPETQRTEEPRAETEPGPAQAQEEAPEPPVVSGGS